MKRILLKSLLLLSPFFMLVSIFVFFDPMKIFYEYDDPTAQGVQTNDRVYQVFYLDRKTLPYNAFIFGSSKSYVFYTNSWEKYIGNQVPYHMSCNDESIYGIAHKLNYLVRKGYHIHDALIVLDERVLMQTTNPSTHIFREDPEVSGEFPLIFYMKFFSVFIQPKFLKAAIEYHEGSRDSSVLSYMNVFHFSFDPETGDRTFAEYDSMLAASSTKFYEFQQPLFPARDTGKHSVLPPFINDTTLELMKQIRFIFEEEHSQYRIVIAPAYNQMPLNPSDADQLSKIFGHENIFDFSGKNRFTSNIYNYYDRRHFKPEVADSLLKKIYR